MRNSPPFPARLLAAAILMASCGVVEVAEPAGSPSEPLASAGAHADAPPAWTDPAAPPPPPGPPVLINARDGAEVVRISPGERTDFPPFYIYRTEVTVRMFRRFAEAVRSDTKFWEDTRLVAWKRHRREMLSIVGRYENSDFPAPDIRPGVGIAYMIWAAGGLPEGTLRLPYRAEWVLAAGRARHPEALYPTTTAHPRGTGILSYRFRNGANIGSLRPEPVGSHGPGDFGLYDMAGNHWEWVVLGNGKPTLVGGSCLTGIAMARLDHEESRIVEAGQFIGLRPVFVPGASRRPAHSSRGGEGF